MEYTLVRKTGFMLADVLIGLMIGFLAMSTKSAGAVFYERIRVSEVAIMVQSPTW